jgi:hypothetical protein
MIPPHSASKVHFILFVFGLNGFLQFLHMEGGPLTNLGAPFMTVVSS